MLLANYLIGLREGLEATLIVSILVAYLVKAGRRDRLPAIAAGVLAAVLLSLAFGAVLTFTSQAMSFQAQERFGGIMSILAVGFVTWMIFWMRRTSRHLKAELQGRMDSALTMGVTTMVVTAFLAVGREGLETALILWPTVQAADETLAPLAGAALGIVTAVLLGWGLYRRALHVNLARFFRWTGAGLVVVAAGVLAYGVHDLQEAGDLPGLDRLAFDVSSTIAPDAWSGTLLKGIFNFSPASTWLQVLVWVAYVLPVMALFLRPSPMVSPAAADAPAVARYAPTAS